MKFYVHEFGLGSLYLRMMEVDLAGFSCASRYLRGTHTVLRVTLFENDKIDLAGFSVCIEKHTRHDCSVDFAISRGISDL
jgi:hypothetical protein